jgi:hypothetical protein
LEGFIADVLKRGQRRAVDDPTIGGGTMERRAPPKPGVAARRATPRDGLTTGAAV